MTYSEFESTTHGKWILSGEHAVIRGHAALVFPLLSKELKLRYHPHQDFESKEAKNTLYEPMHLALNHGMKLLELESKPIQGYFDLENHIPIGMGMGASAALCMAIAKWFKNQKLITDVHDFAHQLEHLFHGKSSGVDIAGVANTTGILFQQGVFTPLKPTWQPLWYLSYSGHQSNTADCVQQVNLLWENNPLLAEQIDLQMSHSVALAKQALTQQNPASLNLLVESIQLAQHCFEQWGLISGHLEQHIQDLCNLGAITAKPTGSGGGGFVLSLWDKPPPPNALFEMIAL